MDEVTLGGDPVTIGKVVSREPEEERNYELDTEEHTVERRFWVQLMLLG